MSVPTLHAPEPPYLVAFHFRVVEFSQEWQIIHFRDPRVVNTRLVLAAEGGMRLTLEGFNLASDVKPNKAYTVKLIEEPES